MQVVRRIRLSKTPGMAESLDWAMNRARKHGLAAASLRHPTHIGRLGEYSERAADAGLVAVVTVGMAGESLWLAIPFGGAAPALGTNPWSMGVPGARGRQVVFDAATIGRTFPSL